MKMSLIVAPAWQPTIAAQVVWYSGPQVPPLLSQPTFALPFIPSTSIHVFAVQVSGRSSPLPPSLKMMTSRGDPPLGPLTLAFIQKEAAVIDNGFVGPFNRR